ncbi:MAG: type II toxin-antitoxin system HicA family toxin [Candidatus Aenigmarchaeota archaeon]|nr:type II toxin-antitoxin system HicA family toxin [Candidatus Aenigmarchaeota archaeon]
MRLFPIAAYKLIRILGKIGFRPVRQEGSHLRLIHPDGRSTTIPIHGAKDIDPNILGEILKQAKLSREEFFKLLKEILILFGIAAREKVNQKNYEKLKLPLL